MSANLPIVAAIDGSTNALDAVRWAARAAARENRRLEIVAAVAPLTTQFSLTALQLQDATHAAAMSFAENATDDAVDLARETVPDIDVTTHILDGKPSLVLRNVSSRAHLLVMGRRGLGGVRGLLMGSVSSDAAAHAECPVVVISEPQENGDGPVVVGVDGSPSSQAAIGRAFAQARGLGTKLVAVYCHGGFTGEAYLEDENVEHVIARLAEEADEELSAQLEKFLEAYPDVVVDQIVREGSAAETIEELSTDAQLVVLGSRGHGGFRGLVLGSISQAVLHVARCPVMVVHG